MTKHTDHSQMTSIQTVSVIGHCSSHEDIPANTQDTSYTKNNNSNNKWSIDTLLFQLQQTANTLLPRSGMDCKSWRAWIPLLVTVVALVAMLAAVAPRRDYLMFGMVAFAVGCFWF